MTNLKKNNGIWLDKMELPELFKVAKSKENLTPPKNAGTIGSASDADAIAIASNGVVTFTQAPVFPDGSLALADLDIDGGTDIGAAIVDADLFNVDDGAGGTNRKVTASR